MALEELDVESPALIAEARRLLLIGREDEDEGKMRRGDLRGPLVFNDHDWLIQLRPVGPWDATRDCDLWT